MNDQRHHFKPLDEQRMDTYTISVSEYSSHRLQGTMIQIHNDTASMTLHEVGTDDLRKLAFMMSSIAEDIERRKAEAVAAQPTHAMTREELKGRQTPGDWLIDADFTAYALNGGTPPQNRMWAHVQPGRNNEGSWISHSERAATCVLIAEAGNVANRTGMWPEDLEQRVKELQEVLRLFDEWASKCPPDKFILRAGEIVEHARAILNKKPA